MKKYIVAFIVAAFFCGFCPVMLIAQSNSSFYIEAGVGAQMLFSKNASDLSFGKRITPAFSLTGGKWFSPYIGARLQFQGYSFNAMSDISGTFRQPDGSFTAYDPARNFNTINPDGSYRRDLRYLNMYAGVQTSLANLLFGYDSSRKWDVLPGIGVGYMQVFEHRGVPATPMVSTHFSLQGKWRFLEYLDFNAELATAGSPDKFDARKTNDGFAWGLGLTVGATYYFSTDLFDGQKFVWKKKERGERKRKVKQTAQAPEQKVERVYVEQVPVPQEVRIEKVEVEKKVSREPFILTSILFDRDKATFDPSQNIQLQNVANYLKKNASVVLRLEGYSDDETGTERYNLNLSLKRTANVCDVLVKEFGVERERIQLVPLGDTKRYYDAVEWNRVVLVIAVENDTER